MHYTADNPLEKLKGSIERVTFHIESSGFCVQRIKVRGHRELGGMCYRNSQATAFVCSPDA